MNRVLQKLNNQGMIQAMNPTNIILSITGFYGDNTEISAFRLSDLAATKGQTVDEFLREADEHMDWFDSAKRETEPFDRRVNYTDRIWWILMEAKHPGAIAERQTAYEASQLRERQTTRVIPRRDSP